MGKLSKEKFMERIEELRRNNVLAKNMEERGKTGITYYISDGVYHLSIQDFRSLATLVANPDEKASLDSYSIAKNDEELYKKVGVILERVYQEYGGNDEQINDMLSQISSGAMLDRAKNMPSLEKIKAAMEK